MIQGCSRSWIIVIGNVTELVANNQKKEISNVAEKFWRSVEIYATYSLRC